MVFPIQLNTANMKIMAVVSFYMTAALVMVFVNKAVLNSSPDLPLVFLFFQLCIAIFLLHLSAAITSKVSIPQLNLNVAKRLVPVVSINIIGLVFNTLCLRDVEASFFQIARGLQLPLTILVSSVYTRSTPSGKVIIATMAVTLGFFIGIAPSSVVSAATNPSLISLSYGIMSSLFIAFHAVLIKSSLPHCNNSTIELAWWTNAGSAVLILPFVILAGEPYKLWDLIHSEGESGAVFFWGSLVTGFFGFLLCIAGLLSIKITSPITHMFSSAARSVLQTLLGVWIFNDLLTVNRGASILVILAGTMYYTWVKSQEAPPPQPPRRDIEQGRSSLEEDEANERRKTLDSEKAIMLQDRSSS